jgi:hypothetical protein
MSSLLDLNMTKIGRSPEFNCPLKNANVSSKPAATGIGGGTAT